MSFSNYTSAELYNLVNTNITNFLHDESDYTDILRQSEEYSLGTGGKRLRPLLFLGAVKMCGGDVEDALPFACAIEYIHTYSLIHDDLPSLDNDDYRRGVKTNHKVYGDDIALLAGDALLTTASEIMVNEISKNPSIEKINAMQQIMSGAYQMISGQIADIKSGKIISQEILSYIHDNKTGALILSSVLAGARFAGADEEIVENLTRFGIDFGRAFQIADDIADFTTDMHANYAQINGIGNATDDANDYINSAIMSINGYEKNDVLLEIASLIKETINGTI